MTERIAEEASNFMVDVVSSSNNAPAGWIVSTERFLRRSIIQPTHRRRPPTNALMMSPASARSLLSVVATVSVRCEKLTRVVCTILLASSIGSTVRTRSNHVSFLRQHTRVLVERKRRRQCGVSGPPFFCLLELRELDTKEHMNRKNTLQRLGTSSTTCTGTRRLSGYCNTYHTLVDSLQIFSLVCVDLDLLALFQIAGD